MAKSTSIALVTSIIAAFNISSVAAAADPPSLLIDLSGSSTPVSSYPTRVTWAPGSAAPEDFTLVRGLLTQQAWLVSGAPPEARRINGLKSFSPSSNPMFSPTAGRTPSGKVALLFAFTGPSYSLAASTLYSVDPLAAQAVALVEGPDLSSTFYPVGERFVFASSSSANGRELWVSDGTPSGTTLLSDIIPGPEASSPAFLTGNGAIAWFTVKRSASDPRELWITDGTAAGTRAIGPLSPLAPDPTLLSAARLGDDVVYAVREVSGGAANFYRASAAAAPSTPIISLGTTTAFATIPPIISTGSHVLFSGVQANVAHLYVSDGTAAGTTAISESLFCFFSNFAVSIDPSAPLGWRVFYAGGPTASSTEPAVTDGTRAGTSEIIDFFPDPGSASPSSFVSLGTRALFSIGNVTLGSIHYDAATFLTDGTAAGTMNLMSVPGAPAGSAPAITTLLGNVLASGRDARGTELWFFSPTRPVFTFVADLDPRSTSTSRPQFFPSRDQNILFSAGVGTQPLYLTDGTPAGTRQVIGPSGPLFQPTSTCPLQLGDFDGQAVIYANSPSTGDEPYAVDRSTGAAALIRDLIPGASGSIDNAYDTCTGSFTAARIGSRLVFGSSSRDIAASHALWSTDGAPGGAGTSQIATFSPPAFGGHLMYNLTTEGNRAFFIAPRLSSGPADQNMRIWVTDGVTLSQAVTFSSTNVIFPRSAAAFNGRFYVAVPSTGVFDGYHLYSTNGADFARTPLGPEADALDISWVLPVSRGLVFQGSIYGSSPARASMWFTDGTAANTVRLATVTASFYTLGIVDTGPFMFFTTYDDRGRELWVSDFTPAGTHIAADLNPGPFSSDATALCAIAPGRVAFSAYTPEHGVELWQSDGTPFGTRLIADLAPGDNSSFPTAASRTGSHILFSADDGSSGREVWTWPISPACRCDLDFSGQSTLPDLFEFLSLYFDNQADFNADSATTLQDLFDFLTCWFSGC